MAETAILAENVGKKYIIAHNQQKRDLSLTYAIVDGIKNIVSHSPKVRKEDFWALRDIDLEIMRGERIGILGNNGAGKSTLLKLFSRVTEPTTGRIEMYGRVSSMLEVGTGFHGDLTGRENIFLNGAILGMTKKEIARKFDEIVAFSEIENFIDTPVKRYSSGMYVRLAFAVAAHLDPDILIVDEVLAVGDTRFQKKCLGRMGEIAGKNNTILYVSHNVGTIRQLCSRVIYLDRGRVTFVGGVEESIALYLKNSDTDLYKCINTFENMKRDGYLTRFAEIDSIELQGSRQGAYPADGPVRFRINITAKQDVKNLCVRAEIRSADDVAAGTSFSDFLGNLEAGKSCTCDLELRGHRLASGNYKAAVSVSSGDNITGFIDHDRVIPGFVFSVARPEDGSGILEGWHEEWGSVRLPGMTAENLISSGK